MILKNLIESRTNTITYNLTVSVSRDNRLLKLSHGSDSLENVSMRSHFLKTFICFYYDLWAIIFIFLLLLYDLYLKALFLILFFNVWLFTILISIRKIPIINLQTVKFTLDEMPMMSRFVIIMKRFWLIVLWATFLLTTQIVIILLIHKLRQYVFTVVRTT